MLLCQHKLTYGSTLPFKMGDRYQSSPSCYTIHDALIDTGSVHAFTGVAFGCSTANGGGMDGALGIVGLGRSALSLLSQLGVGRFSYCLRSDADAGARPIPFGSLANVTGDKVQSTPLVQNPVAARRAPYYYSTTSTSPASRSARPTSPSPAARSGSRRPARAG